ncbi:MAG: OsmC family protein [Chloroflexi bacterium]|nr:OsmC family protein [Chloroflexota bacterium]
MSTNDPAGESSPASLPSQAEPAMYTSVAHLSMLDASLGMAFVAVPPSMRSINIDVGVEHGGAGMGPEPLELLLLALGSCTGMDVISILRKKRQVITHYSINVYANQAIEHPRIFTDILVEHIIGGDNVSSVAVARALELSTTKYCPVHALLSRATHVEQRYHIVGQ